MYVGRCELNVPASGTRDRRLRGYVVSFARCLRVETDLAAAVLLSVLNLDQSILDGVGSARKASKAMPKAKKKHKYK